MDVAGFPHRLHFRQMIRIRRADPRLPEALRLIDGSEAELSALYPPEARFAFSPQELIDAEVRFFLAELDGAALGCCGYAHCGDYAELKRMYVDPSARGRGLAPALLDHLEAAARDEGLAQMRLETGAESHAALTLYARRGYARCGPFGSYAENGSSVFMEKPLA